MAQRNPEKGVAHCRVCQPLPDAGSEYHGLARSVDSLIQWISSGSVACLRSEYSSTIICSRSQSFGSHPTKCAPPVRRRRLSCERMIESVLPRKPRVPLPLRIERAARRALFVAVRTLVRSVPFRRIRVVGEWLGELQFRLGFVARRRRARLSQPRTDGQVLVRTDHRAHAVSRRADTADPGHRADVRYATKSRRFQALFGASHRLLHARIQASQSLVSRGSAWPSISSSTPAPS